MIPFQPLDAAPSSSSRTLPEPSAHPTEALEAELASWAGGPHALGVASGLLARYMAWQTLGIGPGDEVLVPVTAPVEVLLSLRMVGATAKLAEIDPVTYNLDVSELGALHTPRTKAVAAVHLHGHPIEMEALLTLARERGLWVVEDLSDALGASYQGQPVGSFGDLACCDLGPRHALGGLAEAGALLTRNAELLQRAQALRSIAPPMSAHAAQLCLLALARRKQAIDERRSLAKRYTEGIRAAALPGVITPEVLADTRPVYHHYLVRIKDRDRVRQALHTLGVETSDSALLPLYRLAHLGLKAAMAADFPVAARAVGEVLSLPLYPGLSDEQVRTVISALQQALKPDPAIVRPN